MYSARAVPIHHRNVVRLLGAADDGFKGARVAVEKLCGRAYFYEIGVEYFHVVCVAGFTRPARAMDSRKRGLKELAVKGEFSGVSGCYAKGAAFNPSQVGLMQALSKGTVAEEKVSTLK